MGKRCIKLTITILYNSILLTYKFSKNKDYMYYGINDSILSFDIF